MPQQVINNPRTLSVEILTELSRDPRQYFLAEEINDVLGFLHDDRDLRIMRNKVLRLYRYGWLRRRRIDLEVTTGKSYYMNAHKRVVKGWEYQITNMGLGYLVWLRQTAKEIEMLEQEARERRRFVKPSPWGRVRKRPLSRVRLPASKEELPSLIEKVYELPELPAQQKRLLLPPLEEEPQ